MYLSYNVLLETDSRIHVHQLASHFLVSWSYFAKLTADLALSTPSSPMSEIANERHVFVMAMGQKERPLDVVRPCLFTTCLRVV